MAQKQKCLQAIEDTGIIAVLRRQNINTLVKIIQALRNGGIKVFEITLDTPGALNIIEELSQQLKEEDIILGAGTVLDSETARLAILAGAEFIFAPNLNYDVIKLGNRYGKVVIPGVMTPTEIVNAYETGADMVKVFPAGVLGAGYIKSIRGPLPNIPMVPTGGISLSNAADFIKAGAVALGIGSELVDKKAIEKENYEVIEETAAKFTAIVKKSKA